MNLQLKLIAVLAIALTGCVSSKYTYTITEKSITITGKVEKKQWSKSIESYCAQGSDYYTISITTMRGENIEEATYVLETNQLPDITYMDAYHGKTVSCTGHIMEKKWKQENDEMNQHPVGIGSEVDEYYSCTVFRAIRIGLASQNN